VGCISTPPAQPSMAVGCISTPPAQPFVILVLIATTLAMVAVGCISTPAPAQSKVKCLATCIGSSKLTGVCHSSSGMVTETYTYRPRSAKEYVIKATACNSNGKGSACTILEVK